MRKQLKALRKNTAGFTFVELLVVIVIMAVLVAATANYLFSQGGSKARDIERKNDIKQVAALIEQFSSSYGEPPNPGAKNKKLADRFPDCVAVNDFKQMMKCFRVLKYAEGEGLISLAEDPKEGIPNDNPGNEYRYLYGANNNGWKVCALLESQTDPDLNDNYQGTGTFGEEGSRVYCLVSSNRKLSDIPAVEAGSDTSYREE